MSALPSWKSAEIGLFRPFSGLHLGMPENGAKSCVLLFSNEKSTKCSPNPGLVSQFSATPWVNYIGEAPPLQRRTNRENPRMGKSQRGQKGQTRADESKSEPPPPFGTKGLEHLTTEAKLTTSGPPLNK